MREKNIEKIWVGKTGRKRTPGRSRYRWGGNIRIYLREFGWEVV
jgi:hypothetical protein